MAAAEHMHVKVVHRLAGVAAGVHDKAIAALGDAFAFRDVRGGGEQPSNQGLVGRREIRDGCDVLASQDQDVRRSLGRDVADGKHRIVGMNQR